MIEVREVLYRWHKGFGRRTISRSLGMSVNTVRKLIKHAQTLGFTQTSDASALEKTALALSEHYKKYPCRSNSVQLAIAKHHDQIAEWLQISDMTVPQMIRLFSEGNFGVKETSLRDYIKSHFEVSQKSTVHLEITPGHAQVDFGDVGKMPDPKTKELKRTYAFIMTLSYSRMRFVYFTFRQDTDTWIECHIQAFNFFGCVPAVILLDNLKAGIIKPDIYDPTINVVYAELEKHYGFIADPAKVRTPAHKGRVERSVPIIRQQLIAGRSYENIIKANHFAQVWAKDDIAHKIVRTTGETPWERFIRDEKPAMLPLPAEPFEKFIWQAVKAHRDHHVVFKGSFYSVPHAYIGKRLWVRVNGRVLQCFMDGTLIKTHVLASRKGEWVTDVQDYPKSARFFLEQTPEICLNKAKIMGQSIYVFLKEVLKDCSMTHLRKAQAILRLSEQYSTVRLEAACQRALEFENLEYASLKKILEQGLEKTIEAEKKPVDLERIKAGAYLRDPKEFSNEGVSS